MMAELRKQTKAGRNNRGGLRFLSGLKKTGKAQRVDEGGVVEYFFGKDGTKSLSLEEFRKFIEDLQAEVGCAPSVALGSDTLKGFGNFRFAFFL